MLVDFDTTAHPTPPSHNAHDIVRVHEFDHSGHVVTEGIGGVLCHCTFYDFRVGGMRSVRQAAQVSKGTADSRKSGN
jgi:hypothetical protein